MNSQFDVVAMGASAGGVMALQKIFATLGANFTLPIVITLHLPRDTRLVLPLIFGAYAPNLSICEAEDKMPLLPRHVYFAPPGYHLLLEADKSLALSQDEPVHFSRPSIDVMFESVAQGFGARAIGVLLTGANEDGAQGLYEIHKQNGITLVQDPKTAEVPVMPASALKLFKPDHVVALAEVGRMIATVATRGGDE